MGYSLEIENLMKHYQTFSLDSVSFKLEEGSIMGFIGENGAGKSTTIKLMLDLISKDGGTVLFWGKDFKQINKEDIGVVYDECDFHGVLNAKQISSYLNAIYKTWDSKCFFDMLNELSVPTDKRIKDFSRGMKMKLSIAVAMAHNPKLLILDEATSGLDPVAREQVLNLFKQFVGKKENSILISSHITSDLEKIADSITFIHQGKLIFSRPKDELISEYVIVDSSFEQYKSIKDYGVKAYVNDRGSISILMKNNEVILKNLVDYIVREATLDDIILSNVKEAI